MTKKVTVTAVVLASVLALGGCGAMTAMQPTESGETQQSQVSAGNDVSTASSQDPSSASISIAASQAEPEQPEVANGVSSAPEEGSWPTPQGFATPEEVVHAFAKAYLAKDSYTIVSLYAQESMEYFGGLYDRTPDEWRDQMLATWDASFAAVDTGITEYEIQESEELTAEKMEEYFGDYEEMPQNAYRNTVFFSPNADGFVFYFYSIQYGGLWYLAPMV